MSFLKLVVCMLLVLSLVGCAASKNPNPMIRYGANTATTMAVPGWFVATNGSGRFRAVDVMDIRLFPLKLVALSAAGGRLCNWCRAWRNCGVRQMDDQRI